MVERPAKQATTAKVSGREKQLPRPPTTRNTTSLQPAQAKTAPMSAQNGRVRAETLTKEVKPFTKDKSTEPSPLKATASKKDNKKALVQLQQDAHKAKYEKEQK